MRARAGLSLLALVLAAGGGAYWYTASGNRSPAKKAGPAAVPVTLAQAVAGDLPVLLYVVGRAEAYETVTLRARVDGQVAAVAYTEGRHVKAGDVLLRLDPADFDARLRQAEATLGRDQAQLAKARMDLDRYQSLRAKGFVSEEKVGEMRTAVEAQSGSVKASQAAADLARLQVGYATVRAPITGVVGARLVFPGTAVKTNDTALAVVNRAKPLYVTFAVPEKYLPKLQAGMHSGAVKVVVGVPGDAARRFEGTARFLDHAVDPTTGTIQMTAVLPNDDEQLTPGQFLNVSIALDILKNAVTIPAEALQQGPQGTFVFAVADGIAQPRKVDVATVQAGTAAIAKGLQTGETVVTDGQLRLTPGSKVQIREPAAAPAPAKPAPRG
jgi:multidrug efflux system membrane fusion protein